MPATVSMSPFTQKLWRGTLSVELQENVSLLSALPQCLYRTSIFPSAHLRFVSFLPFFRLSLSLSSALYFATFLTSLTKAGTVPCLNGAHLLVLTDASRTPLSKQKPLNATAGHSLCQSLQLQCVGQTRGKCCLNVDGHFS